MRAVRIGMVGLGALLAGWVAIGCSSNAATSDDAGPELDAFFGPDDGAAPDTSTPIFRTDAGDATVPGTDATAAPGDDAGDSTAPSDTGAGADTSDAKSAASDAGDAAVPDGGTADSGAADAGSPDGSAGDAGAPDSSAADSASDDAASEDAGSEAASEDAGSEDAGSEDAGFDASLACTALNGGDPIQGVLAGQVLSDGGVYVVNYQYGATPSGSGQAPTGASVTFEAWTVPQGVMSSISVMYWLGTNSGSIQSIPLVPGPGPAGEDSWTGTLAAQTSGTTVTWWVQATDVCHSGTDYYSNNNANYVYTTQ